MSADSEITGGLSELEAELADTFTFPVSGGTTYDCLASVRERGKKLEIGGFQVDVDVVLVVRVAEFGVATPPASGDTLTFRSVTYRVESVRRHRDVFVRIFCVNPAR